MNVVLGGRATVGKNCHIGAGAVLAGVVEPPSAQPVVVEDDVVIGANAVVLEGVKVGKGSVVAAEALWSLKMCLRTQLSQERLQEL